MNMMRRVETSHSSRGSDAKPGELDLVDQVADDVLRVLGKGR
jgi:hypothetical protein